MTKDEKKELLSSYPRLNQDEMLQRIWEAELFEREGQNISFPREYYSAIIRSLEISGIYEFGIKQSSNLDNLKLFVWVEPWKFQELYSHYEKILLEAIHV